MRKTIVTALVSLALAGCAAKNPQMSRDDWLQATTREYQGVDQDKLLTAAEQVFRWADGDDFSFSHSQTHLHATRNWSFYLVLAAGFGIDQWIVEAHPTSDGIRAAVQVASQSQGVAPTPTTGGNFSAGTTPTLGGASIQGTALYRLFWERLEYAMGIRADYPDCEMAESWKKSGEVWGDISPLCNSLNIQETGPEHVILKKKQAEQRMPGDF